MSRRRGWKLLVACSPAVLVGSVTLGLGAAQGGVGLDNPRDPPGGEGTIGDGDGEAVGEQRAEVRDRLVRRLEWTRERVLRYAEHEKGLVRAIERLDAGESTEAIYDDMHERAEGGMGSRRAMDDGDGDGARRGPMGRRGGRLQEPLDAESRRRVLSMLESHSPALSRQVAEFREGNAEQADRLLQRIAPKLNEIRAAQESDPDLATLFIIELHANLDLTVRSRDLREMLGGESPDEREIALARERIRDSLRSSFDAHLAVKEHEVRQLEAQLQKLRGEINRRKQMRDDFIDRQFDSVGSPMDSFRHRGRRG